MEGITTIILAAGQSLRMGSPKALLKWNEQFSFIDKLVHEYFKAGVDKIIVVTNPTNKNAIKELLTFPSIEYLINKKENSDRMDSIAMALRSINNSNGVFIQDVDRPFITKEIIIDMSKLLETKSYVSPRFNDETGHPVLLSIDIVEIIKNKTVTNTTLRQILNDFTAIYYETASSNVLANINTQEDYLKYFP